MRAYCGVEIVLFAALVALYKKLRRILT